MYESSQRTRETLERKAQDPQTAHHLGADEGEQTEEAHKRKRKKEQSS